jgi:hypothetical protein
MRASTLIASTAAVVATATVGGLAARPLLSVHIWLSNRRRRIEVP